MTHPPIRKYCPLGMSAEVAGFVNAHRFHPARGDRPWDAGRRSCRCRGNRRPGVLRDSWDATETSRRARIVGRAAGRNGGRRVRLARERRDGEKRIHHRDTETQRKYSIFDFWLLIELFPAIGGSVLEGRNPLLQILSRVSGASLMSLCLRGESAIEFSAPISARVIQFVFAQLGHAMAPDREWK